MNWKPYELNAEATQLIDQRNFAAAREKCDEVEACCKNPRLLECLEYRKITLDAALTGDYTGGYRKLETYAEKYPRGQLQPVVENTLAMWSMIVELESQVAEDPRNVTALNGLGGLLIRVGSSDAAARSCSASGGSGVVTSPVLPLRASTRTSRHLPTGRNSQLAVRFPVLPSADLARTISGLSRSRAMFTSLPPG